MANALRTGVLLSGLTALFMAVGYFIGGTQGMMLAFGFALVTNFIGYWNADKMVLRMQHAEQIDPHSVPDLYAMVERLAAQAGIPTPKIYLIRSEQPNAFATGRNPENAAVALSAGLLRYLDSREVEAVIAHELAHIRNRDTLTMTITATFAGAISMLAQFGLFFGGGNNRDNPLGGFGALLMVFLAPIAAMLVQMAISRTREYEADARAAEITGDPMALASALGKISQLSHRTINIQAERNPAMAHMYIINPLSGARVDNLFSTHPDPGNRIDALRRIAESMRVEQYSPGASAWTRTSAMAPGQGPWSMPSDRTDNSRGFRSPWE